MSGSTNALQPGQPAPSFSAPDQNGDLVESAELLSRNTVLYFFPSAGTPGCTKEAADFQDHLEQFNKLGYQVVGISPDSVQKLKAFEDDHELEFTLLSDPDTEVHRLYGAHGEKTIFGRIYNGVLRSTVVIADGKVREALYNVRATGHIPNLLRLISQ